jgi:hypothetical protein
MTELAYSLEVQGMIALLRSFGLPHRITDVDTPGVHTDGSYHYAAGTGGDGLAIDFAGLVPYSIDPATSRTQMLAICKALEPYESKIAELICSHLPYSIKHGRRVARYAVSSHWNHGHLAVERGVFLRYVTTPLEVIVVPDNPDLPNIEGPLTFHPLQDANGVCTGYFIFSQKTGELHSFGPGVRWFGRSEDITP